MDRPSRRRSTSSSASFVENMMRDIAGVAVSVPTQAKTPKMGRDYECIMMGYATVMLFLSKYKDILYVYNHT